MNAYSLYGPFSFSERLKILYENVGREEDPPTSTLSKRPTFWRSPSGVGRGVGGKVCRSCTNEPDAKKVEAVIADIFF